MESVTEELRAFPWHPKTAARLGFCAQSAVNNVEAQRQGIGPLPLLPRIARIHTGQKVRSGYDEPLPPRREKKKILGSPFLFFLREREKRERPRFFSSRGRETVPPSQ